jgi:DNA-binding phage protein
MSINHTHEGSSFDDFLREEGLYEEATSIATARVLAWQLQQQMDQLGITKVEMARRMGTSRSQLDRLLKPDSAGVTLDTIHRAAKAVGRELRVELI